MFASSPPGSTLSRVSSLPLVCVYLYNLHEVSHNRHKELENAIYVEKRKELELSVSGEDVSRRYGGGHKIHGLLRLDNANQLSFPLRMETVAQKH